MSKISLKPNASGTGVFSLEAPNSNVDRTLNLPDEAGTLATVENLPAGYTDSDALDLFNVTGTAPVYACRAWVNFDGNGSLPIRGSGNVSSITDRGTGQYTVNFATAMTDDDYATVATSSRDKSTSQVGIFIENYFPTAVEVREIAGTTFYDVETVNVTVFR
jgi:hypothetical protein